MSYEITDFFMLIFLKAYEPSICRSLGAHHVGKSEYMGVETDEFAVDIGSPENSKQCFCREEDDCTKKGANRRLN